MNMKYYTSQIAPSGTEGSLNTAAIIVAGDITLMCRFVFDNDDISDTYNHWICIVDIVDDEHDYPERSFVMHPDTAPFDFDSMFSIIVTAPDVTHIGFNDLSSVYLTVGVPVNE